MRTIRAIDLSKMLGLSRRTVSGWCANDPKLAYKKNGVYVIRLSELAKRPGFDIISALTLETAKWIKAVDLAAISNQSRRTISYWAKNRPRFAKRVGRVWYIDLETLGASDDHVEVLRQWAPQQQVSIKVLETLNFLKKVWA